MFVRSERSIPLEQIQTTSGHGITAPRYSIVIPVYNEADSIAQLLIELRGITRDWHDTYEVLVIDDGSTDGSAAVVARCFLHWSEGRLIQLNENYGQAAALLCGMKRALGRIIVLMDGDGQNDPGDIPALLEPLAQVDMVVGIRINRQDSVIRRLMSRSANFVRRRFLKDYVSDSGCGIKAFHRKVAEAFIPMRTLYSFMPALALSAGFSLREIPVRHRPRTAGTSKYGVRQFLWKPFLDLFGVWWFTRRRCQIAFELEDR
jgi:dolichol-phosphate mannosyltransferase